MGKTKAGESLCTFEWADGGLRAMPQIFVGCLFILPLPSLCLIVSIASGCAGGSSSGAPSYSDHTQLYDHAHSLRWYRGSDSALAPSPASSPQYTPDAHTWDSYRQGKALRTTPLWRYYYPWHGEGSRNGRILKGNRTRRYLIGEIGGRGLARCDDGLCPLPSCPFLLGSASILRHGVVI